MTFEVVFDALCARRRLDAREQQALFAALTSLAEASCREGRFRQEAVDDVFIKLLSLARTGGLDEVARPRSFVATMLRNRQRDLLRRDARVRRTEREVAAASEGLVDQWDEAVDLSRVSASGAKDAVRAWIGDLVEGAMVNRRGSSGGVLEAVDEILGLAFDDLRTEEVAARHGLTAESSAGDRKRIINNVHQRHHRVRALLQREVRRRFDEGLIDQETYERWMEGLEALRRCQSAGGADVSVDEDGAR